MILVAGLPSSGNRLIQGHIELGLREAGIDEFVQVWHGDNESPNLDRPEGERLAVVIPVRDEAMRKASVEKRLREGDGLLPLDVATMQVNVPALIEREGAASHWLRYEDLVADPEGEGRKLFEALGIPWVPWPVQLYDANAAHRQ